MALGSALNISIAEKRFREADGPLFKDFRLSVAQGEVVALIGPSGVGKSTLLRMIAGIDRDFEGELLVEGLPAADAPRPGFVFQDARLLPWLDAAQNIAAMHDSIDHEKVLELLAQVGLGASARALPRQLSGGMQRRLGLARALSVNPGLLLLDEPFVSLDSVIVGELQVVFQRIFALQHPTVVLVSHNPEDAARLADRVITLQGSPVRIISDFRIATGRAQRGPIEIARIAEQIRVEGMEASS